MKAIRELRRICQEERRPYDTWHGRTIARPVSIYVTVLFLKLNLSANFVTAVFLFTGIIGSACCMLGIRMAVWAGALLFQLWYILDHVDGEVARHRKEVSLTGVYFDYVSHYIVHPLFFFSLGVGLFLRTHNLAYIILGSLGAFSLTLLGVEKDLYDLITLRKAKVNPVRELRPLTDHCADGGIKPPSASRYTPPTSSVAFSNGVNRPHNIESQSSCPGMRRIFSLFHAACTFPVIIDIFFIISFFDVFLNKNLIIIFLWFYAVSLTILWVSRVSYFILTRKMDKECQGA